MKEDILTKIPDMDYTEEAPVIDANEFDKVIRSRRSVRVYTNDSVPQEVMDTALEHATLAPNSSNLQPWRFVWIKSEEAKKKVVEACLNQAAARTASELVVILARTKAWPSVKEKMINVLTESEAPRGALSYYRKIVPLAYDQGFLNVKGFLKKLAILFIGFKKPVPRGPASYSDMRVWAHKSTALACENMMLSFRAQGYDTCPMEGFDEKRIKAVLGSKIMEGGAEVCMVLSVGKRADNGIYGPQIRMDKEDFISVI
jgi:nitroreductase